MQSTINQTRRIGIELEFVLPVVTYHFENIDVQRLIASVLTNEGMRSFARPYSHAPVPDGNLFCIESDSSLQGEQRYSGIRWAHVELKSAPLAYPELDRVLPATLDVIAYLGGRCNKSTGFHVHHHIPEITERPQIARNLEHFWWSYHQVLFGLLPPSRSNNQYCRKPHLNQATQFDRVRNYADLCSKLGNYDRYNGVNLLNLASSERMTVEWRLHSGTIDFEKIGNWILATQRWTEHCISRSVQLRAEPVANTQPGLNSLLIASGLKPNSRIYAKVEKDMRRVGKYLLKRWKHFSKPATNRKSVAA